MLPSLHCTATNLRLSCPASARYLRHHREQRVRHYPRWHQGGGECIQHLVLLRWVLDVCASAEQLLLLLLLLLLPPMLTACHK